MKAAIILPGIGRAASRGMTIIELLIAVTIGLLLTIVIAQLFLGSRQTFTTTDDLSRMQENVRFTQQLLIRTVHLAGYKSQPNSDRNTVFGPPNAALAAVDGGGSNSDTLIVRYQGSGNGAGGADGTVVDCLGNRVDSGVMTVSVFTVAPGANGSNALFCNNVEIVPDVVNMQVLFGEDTTVPSDVTVDRYVSLPNITSMDAVLSVRIALMFQTPTATSKALADAVRTYDLNGEVLGPYNNDLRIRRVVTTTINLRNRTP